ncbi:histidinol-phosphate transaminase [Gammaproteobacteria bacterium]|nr:histidinol-phosphate transaminase [Gammaproteobacteria bacterium]
MSVCESILSLTPYQGGRPISEIQREYGLSNVIKLASNENPLGVSKKVQEAIKSAITQIGRYPDGNGYYLKDALAKKLTLSAKSITLGNGSNDILELIPRAYVCSKDDEVIFSQYAFVVYPLVTKAIGAKAIVAPSNDFGHDLNAMYEAITDKTKVIFIANPNNPTGTLLSNEEIYNFLKKVSNDIIVVLDQAYIEYLDVEDVYIDWLKDFPNLVITRSFSKAYGLAGLRVGYSISSEEIADYLNRIRQPFNVNLIAQEAAIAALSDADFLAESVKVNSDGLLQLEEGFRSLGLKFIKSHANFISVKVSNSMELNQKLLEKGIIVRPVEMKDYLRISVGTYAENAKFLEILKEII